MTNKFLPLGKYVSQRMAGMGREAGRIEALAEQDKCACDSCAWCTKYKKCNREMLGLPKAEPVKQEPVCLDSLVRDKKDFPICDHEYIDGWNAALDKAEQHLNAAPVSAKREFVDLTDYEIVRLYAESPMCDSEMIDFARAVIAAFKEKNK